MPQLVPAPDLDRLPGIEDSDLEHHQPTVLRRRYNLEYFKTFAKEAMNWHN